MTAKIKNNKIYVDVELFKNDFCGRLSPDLLQKREIATQTDDESVSECSLNSADTVLKESQANFDGDESLTEDEKTDGVNSPFLHILSSKEDNHKPSEKCIISKKHSSAPKKQSPLLVEHILKPVDDSASSVEENSPTLKQYTEPSTSTNKSTFEKYSLVTSKNPSTSRNKSTPEDCSLTSVENVNTSKNKSTPEDHSLMSIENPSISKNKFISENSVISSSEEIIPPSPVHTVISSDSTISMKSTKQKSKKIRKKIIHCSSDDSTDNQSNIEPVNKQRTDQRRMKKNKSSTTKITSPKKPQVKGKKKIVMNKVVYPSSYPTSTEESSSDDPLDTGKGTKLSSLSSKLLADKAQNKKPDIISLSEDDS